MNNYHYSLDFSKNQSCFVSDLNSNTCDTKVDLDFNQKKQIQNLENLKKNILPIAPLSYLQGMDQALLSPSMLLSMNNLNDKILKSKSLISPSLINQKQHTGMLDKRSINVLDDFKDVVENNVKKRKTEEKSIYPSFISISRPDSDLFKKIEAHILSLKNLTCLDSVGNSRNTRFKVNFEGVSVILKGDAENKRAYQETLIYQLANLMKRQDLVAPVKVFKASSLIKENFSISDWAMQLYLDSPKYQCLSEYNKNPSDLDLLFKQLPFQNLVEAIFFEIILGMTDCIPENLCIDLQTKVLIHIDNEHALTDSNELSEDDDNALPPFQSFLLSAPQCFVLLSKEEKIKIENEIKSYKINFSRIQNELSLPENQELLIKGCVSEPQQALIALQERIELLDNAANRLQDNYSLFELVLEAFPSYRQVVYAKAALTMYALKCKGNQCLNAHLPFSIHFYQEVLSEKNVYSYFWNDLASDLEDDLQGFTSFIKDEGVHLNPVEFLEICNTYLNHAFVGRELDRSPLNNDDT